MVNYSRIIKFLKNRKKIKRRFLSNTIKNNFYNNITIITEICEVN